MSASVKWEGLAELMRDLKSLPADLTDDAAPIVTGSAEAAESEARSGYEQHVRTGNLARGLKVITQSVGRFGVASMVRNTAKHAAIFENGTQARHTSLGANRGSMPPGKVFVPAMVRHRQRMYDQLKAMLVSHGLKVSGDADR